MTQNELIILCTIFFPEKLLLQKITFMFRYSDIMVTLGKHISSIFS